MRRSGRLRRLPARLFRAAAADDRGNAKREGRGDCDGNHGYTRKSKNDDEQENVSDTTGGLAHQ